MRLSLLQIFLTLVVLLVHSRSIGAMSPGADLSPSKTIRTDDDVPLSSSRKLVYQSHTLGTELRFDRGTKVGLLYQGTRSRPDLTAINWGTVLTTDLHYGAHLDYQWNLALGNSYEPFIRGGVGGFFSISEELATFIKVENYQGRLTAGFEDLCDLERRLRTEFLLTLSTRGVSIGISLSWAFESIL